MAHKVNTALVYATICAIRNHALITPSVVRRECRRNGMREETITTIAKGRDLKITPLSKQEMNEN